MLVSVLLVLALAQNFLGCVNVRLKSSGCDAAKRDERGGEPGGGAARVLPGAGPGGAQVLQQDIQSVLRIYRVLVLILNLDLDFSDAYPT